MDADLQAVKEIASKHGRDRSALISVLQDVHAEYNYLPEGSLEIISREMGVPLSSVYGVATFFRAFSFKPETTRDKQFTLETVNCLGCCAVGPVMVVDGEYHGEMTPQQVEAVLKGTS
jgi:NADH-quinone oxidoreductase subunit E